MKIDPYLHAVLLLHGAGKEINEANISAVVKAAGVEPDTAKAKVLAEAVKGLNFEDLLKNVAVSAPVAAAPAAGAQAEKKEEKKEEKKSEEEAAAGLANLFG